MKHPTEKPSEENMRFFTADRYLQFNSADDSEADRADEVWETTLREYQRHLDRLRHEMPPNVRKLSELCLHDAEVLGFAQEGPPITSYTEPNDAGTVRSTIAILTLKQNRTILSLFYLLCHQVREYPAKADWPFSKTRKHWLYDEIDLEGVHGKTFQHRILFSDGTVFSIPFTSVIVNNVILPDADQTGATRRIA